MVKPGPWDSDESGFGPVISPQAKERIVNLISKGKEEANCLIDGSSCTVEGYPNGNWVGTTLFSELKQNQKYIKLKYLDLSYYV